MLYDERGYQLSSSVLGEEKKLVLKYLEIAKIFASMSKCVSHQVGCVIVKDGRILSTGYNGTPRGSRNCSEIFYNYDPETDRARHMEFSDKFEIHSEQNAIIWAARVGISIIDSEIYCTHQPCFHCLKMMIQAGIRKIYFEHIYDRIGTDKKWWNFALDNDIKIYHIENDQ